MEIHDKLLKEVLAKIDNNILELESIGYDKDFICQFLDSIQSHTHYQWLDFIQERDMEFDHKPQNNPARY